MIGTILSALAVGAVFGGRLADRFPDARAYGGALLLAGSSLASIPALARPLLASSIGALERAETLALGASLLSASLLLLGRLERTRTYVGDARAVLRRLSGPYDVILIDVFRGTYIPFHLLTKEFFGECARKLAPGGVIALNIASGTGREDRLLEAVASTLRTSFAQVWHMEISARSALFSNHVFVAGQPGSWTEQLVAAPPDPLLAGAVIVGGTPARDFAFTDDRAPVELYTDRWILGSLFHQLR